MSELDPVQALLSLGLLSQEIVAAAATIPADVATTRAGRLIAAGADPEQLLTHLSQLSGLPLAPADALERQEHVELPPEALPALRGLLACPLRVEHGALQIVVAEPDVKDAVRAVAPGAQLYLAAEVDVRMMLDRLDALARAAPKAVLLDVGKRVERPWEPHSDPASSKPPPPPVRPAGAAVPPPLKRELTGVQARPDPKAASRRPFLFGVGTGLLLGVLSTAIVVLATAPAVAPAAPEPRGARQAVLVEEARASAGRGDHAWTVTKCTEALDIDGRSRLAAEALILCGRAKLAIADPGGVDDLRRALQMLSPGDPLRIAAETALRGAAPAAASVAP